MLKTKEILDNQKKILDLLEAKQNKRQKTKLKLSGVLKIFFSITLTSYYMLIGYTYSIIESYLTEGKKLVVLSIVLIVGTFFLLGVALIISIRENLEEKVNE